MVVFGDRKLCVLSLDGLSEPGVGSGAERCITVGPSVPLGGAVGGSSWCLLCLLV